MTAEKLQFVAPLGLRLWDEGAAAVVSDALDVSASLESLPAVAKAAARSSSGQFVFHGLPGLGAFERGELGYDLKEAPPARRRYVVTITHKRGEFLPVRFVCEAPQWGLAVPEVAKGERPLTPRCQTAPVPSLPLFPAVHRAVGGGLAVARAELHVFGGKAPAKWALIEAAYEGKLVGRGLADEKGRASLVFPYPPLDPGGSHSHPPWSLSFSVYHYPTKPMDKRANLDEVMRFPRVKLRPIPPKPTDPAAQFADALAAELKLNRPLELGALELNT